MIDLDRIEYLLLNGKFVSPNEASEISRLARLGLWAEKHGIPTLTTYSEHPFISAIAEEALAALKAVSP